MGAGKQSSGDTWAAWFWCCMGNTIRVRAQFEDNKVGRQLSRMSHGKTVQGGVCSVSNSLDLFGLLLPTFLGYMGRSGCWIMPKSLRLPLTLSRGPSVLFLPEDPKAQVALSPPNTLIKKGL